MLWPAPTDRYRQPHQLASEDFEPALAAVRGRQVFNERYYIDDHGEVAQALRKPPFDIFPEVVNAWRASQETKAGAEKQRAPGIAEGSGHQLREGLPLGLDQIFLVDVSSKTELVELVGRYSSQTEQMKRTRRCMALARQSFPARPEPAPISTRRVQFRLDEQLVAQLLEEYQAGSTGRELAERYGLARSTVIALLRKHGVAVRHPRVSAEEGAEMLRLYRLGRRQVDIAERYGRAPGNVWHVLKRLGAFDIS